MIKGEILPEGWKMEEFNKLFKFEKKSKKKAGEGKIEGRYKFFTSSNIQSKFIDDYEYNAESLVFGTGGNASIHYCDEKFSCTADCFVTTLKTSKINIKFVYYFFLANMHILEYGFRGISIKHLSKKYLSKVMIFYPKDIKKQDKIVEILERAEKLKEWRAEADESNDEFLKSAFLDMFGDPVLNPKKWKKMPLSALGTWQSGGTPSRNHKIYFTGEIPWYTSGELNSIYIADSVEKITKEAIENSNAKLIESNSLLLGMYDTAALKSSITTVSSSCNQAIAYSELEYGKVDIIYLYFAIQIGRKFFMSRQRGVRQKNLNLSMVKSLKIPIPPLKLQKDFENLVKKIENIKENQKHSKKLIDELFNNLMQKAFKGELSC